MGRALLLGLAFANLVYLRLWAELLVRDRTALFLPKQPFSPAQYLALLVNVIALGAATAVLIRLAPRVPSPVRICLLVCGAALIALAARAFLARDQTLLRAGLFQYVSPSILFCAAAASLGALFFLALKYAYRTERAAGHLMMAISPFLLVTLPQAAWHGLRPARPSPEPRLAAFQAATPPGRVVWIIFDEWDYRLTFADRPPAIALPTLDRLRAESFAADAAVPPSNATAASMPAFLYGRLTDFREFGTEPNLFSLVHSEGWNAAVAGWYLPYCRVFAQVLSTCYWDDLYDQSNSSGSTFAGALQYQARSLFETNLFSLFGQSAVAQRHAQEYLAILEQARGDLADPRLALTLVHFNVPHPPYFYDARSGSLDAAGRAASGYPDALALVDRTLTQLLSSLRQSGLGPRTALVISSDHWLRSSRQVDGKEDHHVPFLVYLPGGGPGTRYKEEFPTLVTRDLILELLENRLTTHAQVGQWISLHTAPPPSSGSGN